MDLKKVINEEHKKLKHFGPKIMLLDILSRTTKFKIFYEKKHRAILDYLSIKYNNIISEYQTKPFSQDTINPTSPVWVFWYQGFENAPNLVKACLKSLKTNAQDHPVIELTKDNFLDYVDIPDFILDKFNKGGITVVQFSDILRASLLAKYGGCWSDATLFYNSWIKEDIYQMGWYSLKQNPVNKDSKYVSGYNWSSFFQSCSINSILTCFLRDVFYEYWKDHEIMIDYFLIDYIIALGVENIPRIHDLVENVPYNNENIFWLSENINKTFVVNDYLKVTKDTVLFKLNWRINIDDDQHSYANKIIFCNDKL